MLDVEKEIEAVIDNFCLMDDDYMTKFFENNIPGTELLLQIILQDATIKVKKVVTQKVYKNLRGHDVWLDIVAKKADGTLFNVEVQNKSKGAAPQRARYHASILDSNSLPKGKYYSRLPETYVIFITKKDVLKRGLPLYHIQRTILEDGSDFGDGSHIVYVNGTIKDKTPLGRLMHDFSCKQPEKMYYDVLAKKATYIKKTQGGREVMSDIMDRLMKRYAKEVAREEKKKALYQKSVEVAQNLLLSGVAVDVIANATKLPVQEVRKLAQMQGA